MVGWLVGSDSMGIVHDGRIIHLGSFYVYVTEGSVADEYLIKGALHR